MSVINRIEICNFLNLDNRKPHEEQWEPHWRHVVLNLRGVSSAIVATNGVGKSTTNNALYAILTRDRFFVAETRKRVAPKRKGYYSHVRVEVLYQDASIVRTPGLIGTDVPGEPYVFGFYGYSDAKESLHFYTFRGHLEDVPVVTGSGHRKTLIPNTSFVEDAKKFPSCKHDVAEPDWRELVQKHFDKGLLAQLVQYQRSGGGDGADHFFQVQARHGEDYDSAFFFTHIAPEILVNCMGSSSKDGEYRFEDTLLESARPVLRARAAVARTGIGVERHRQTFEGLSLAKAKSEEWQQTREDLGRLASHFRAESDFLDQIVVKHSLPGIPVQTFSDSSAPETQWVSRHVVLLDGQAVLRDSAIAAILGSEPKTVNREAAERKLSGHALRGAQVIENPGHLNIHESDRGHPNQGYSKADALALLKGRERYGTSWSLDKATRAIQYGFELVERNDPNPARRKATALDVALGELKDQIDRNKASKLQCEGQAEKLAALVQQIDAANYVLTSMIDSGLFTRAEIEHPGSLAASIESEIANAGEAVNRHRLRNTELEPSRAAYGQVVQEFESVTPATLEGLVRDRDEATDRRNNAKTAVETAEKSATDAALALDRAREMNASVQSQSAILKSLLDRRDEFDVHFAGESPIGLQRQVQDELSAAQKRSATLAAVIETLEIALREFEAILPRVAAFEEEFGGDNPKLMSTQVHRDLADAKDERTRLKGVLEARTQERAELTRGLTALREMAATFGSEVDVEGLEQSLAQQAIRVGERLATLLVQLEQARQLNAFWNHFEQIYGTVKLPSVIQSQRAARAPLAQRERDALAAQVTSRERRLGELESAQVSPGDFAQAVLECLEHQGGRVHEIIGAAGTSEDRRRLLFTHFSHVLHSPVVETPEEAERALARLDAAQIESPVFLRHALEAFCRDGHIESTAELAYSFMAGSRTLQVRALIDPKEIELLAEQVRQELSVLRPKLAAADAEVADLDATSTASMLVADAVRAEQADSRSATESLERDQHTLKEEKLWLDEQRSPENLAVIRRAAQFIQAGGEVTLSEVSATITTLDAEITLLEARFPRLERRTSQGMLDAIAAAIRFAELGGRQAHRETQAKDEGAKAERDQLLIVLPRLADRAERIPLIAAAEEFENLGGRTAINSADRRIKEATEVLATAIHIDGAAKDALRKHNDEKVDADERQEWCKTRWMEWKAPLELGIYFLKEEGLEFDRTYEERLVSLRNAERRTQLRSRFDFVLAQRAADLRSDPDGEAVLLEQHRKLIGDIQRLRDDIEADEERREKDKSQLDTLRSLAARIDRAVNSIMSQWRKAQDLRERVPLFEQSSSVEDSLYLRAARQQVDDIGDLDPSLSGDEMLVNLLEDLASNVQELPLAQRETELTGLKKQLSRNETELRSACKASLESKEADFSEAERSALDPINEIQLVARAVVDVYRSVELHLLGAQRLYSQSLEDAAAAEQRMIATITEFTTRLQDNFDELKRVLSRRGSTNEATLTISGTLVDETEIKGQVDFLVKTVDTEERHRREKQEQKSNVESDDAFSDRLKDTIRNGFYRAVFRAPADGKSSGPTIVFQHPEIADGRPIRLTREFSTGQANALALFILTKMADFALHRDSMHESTGFESRSRLKPSTTRVVIIDGLFSNLSNKQMIRNSLSAVRSLKGSFQLIGWIHRDDYENDPELFPTCIGLRRVRPNRGFVLAEDRNDVSEDLAPLFAHGEIKPLEIHMDTIPSA